IIVTTAEAAGRPELRTPLEDAGAEIEVARDGTFLAALERLAARNIVSLMLGSGAAPPCAGRGGGLRGFLSVYVARRGRGEAGVDLLPGRSFSTAALHNRVVAPLGPDVLVEGYVHRPH